MLRVLKHLNIIAKCTDRSLTHDIFAFWEICHFLYDATIGVGLGAYWFHLDRLSVCPSVRMWTESCPFCVFSNIIRIHFIFTYVINLLPKVSCVKLYKKTTKFDFLAISLNLHV